jgi:hypothetical protein
VRAADFDTPEYDAESVTRVVAATLLVATANVAEVDPAGIVTDAGTVAAGELVVSLTTAPPVGAGPPRVTVPRTLEPPVTDAGETETPVSAAVALAGSTVRVAVLVPPP